MVDLNAVTESLRDLRLGCILTSLLEMFFLAHGSVAYPDIEFVMREEDYFPNKTDTEYTTIYSWLYSLMTIYALLVTFCFTFLVDFVGFWNSRYVIHASSIAGTVVLFFMQRYHIDYLSFVGVPLFYGTSRAFNAGHALVSKIYPEKSSFVLNLQYLPMALSQGLYYLYIALSADSRWWFWFAILMFQPISILRTFYFLPRYNLRKDQNDIYVLGKRSWKDVSIKKQKLALQANDLEEHTDHEKMTSTDLSVSPEKIEIDLGATTDKNQAIPQDYSSPDQKTNPVAPEKENGFNDSTYTSTNVTARPGPKSEPKGKLYWLASVASLPNLLACAIPAIQSVRLAAYIAQFQSLLKFEITNDSHYPTEESREEALKYYTHVVMISIGSNIVGLPLQGFLFDKLREFIQGRFEKLDLPKASIVVALIKFFYVCVTLTISNLLMLAPGTGWPFITSIALITNTTILTYAARYIYLFNTNAEEFHGRLTALAQCWQILTPVVIPLLAYMLTNLFEGNWDKQILLYTLIDALTFVLLIWLVFTTWNRVLK